ncbi:thiolase family protein [Suttonella ornithocola]|uniref:Probable acetyl-CoA acyltransferase n=1 Tax=Suttonella ornithocola TaxID=279832 RepID=A0A380MWN5_9GAMM|nr:thiolase family protein [Suttonella ornithocola]SUO96979.1 Probable acetyl-CoA acyltransferase [Suttonella ornithocola]
MREAVYIIAAQRTPIGSFLGTLTHHTACDLGEIVTQAALKAAQIDPELIDSVIVGNVLSATAGMGIARQIALNSGLPEATTAHTLNMICGSGMKAVTDAYAAIKAGDADIILAIGTESMSNAGFILDSSSRHRHKIGELGLKDEIQLNGLTDAFHHIPMGKTAENLAEKYNISREEQDDYALSSQKKAALAQQSNCFQAEIIPIQLENGNIFQQDEHIRANIDRTALARLHPLFKKDGTVTAGNSSGINDGAAALLIAGENAVKRHHLTPLAEIIGYGQGGVAPEEMGLGVIPAIAQALERAETTLNQITQFELNEAFAAQIIAAQYELSEQHEIDLEEITAKTNLYGGAIALGHPLACSGTRILTTLTHTLPSNHIGLASLCIGGGMGIATVIRKIT